MLVSSVPTCGGLLASIGWTQSNKTMVGIGYEFMMLFVFLNKLSKRAVDYIKEDKSRVGTTIQLGDHSNTTKSPSNNRDWLEWDLNTRHTALPDSPTKHH